jgi:hypothetical protein
LAALVYGYFMTRLSVGLFAAITLASGLLFLGGLLVILGLSSGPPAYRGERLRRWSGITLVVLGMAMTFMGSFGVSLLFGFTPRPATGTGEVIVFILFGPVYYLGLPVFLLGLWLLGRGIGRGRD